MFNKINKKFFIGSLIIHIIFLILLLCFNSNSKINKIFVVYGVHSKKPTNTYFKPLKQASKSNWINVNNKKNNNQSRQQPTKISPNKSKTQKISKKKNSSVKEPKKISSKNKSSKIKVLEQKNIKTPTSIQESDKKIKNKKIKEKSKAKNKKYVKKEKEKPKEQPEEQKPKQTEQEEDLETTEPESPQDEKSNQPKTEELHFNLMGEQDPNLAIYQKHIQKEVERLWHPPIGVPKGTECILSFLVDSSGNIEKYDVVKKSNVLIYDLSILRIAKNFKFDQSLWNKKFTIEFRQ